MAALDQPLPAGTMRAPTRRWSEYTLLSRQVKQAGLLERRRGWYGARIGRNLVLLAAGGVAVVLLGSPGGSCSPPSTWPWWPPS